MDGRKLCAALGGDPFRPWTVGEDLFPGPGVARHAAGRRGGRPGAAGGAAYHYPTTPAGLVHSAAAGGPM